MKERNVVPKSEWKDPDEFYKQSPFYREHHRRKFFDMFVTESWEIHLWAGIAISPITGRLFSRAIYGTRTTSYRWRRLAFLSIPVNWAVYTLYLMTKPTWQYDELNHGVPFERRLRNHLDEKYDLYRENKDILSFNDPISYHEFTAETKKEKEKLKVQYLDQLKASKKFSRENYGVTKKSQQDS
mmetsp:Transcript_58420/g.66643  ORF Transcript_58420/g.66643 Transcript_58420/m.66643 type:complete len:184 (-) Transcript_58420:213-764(-)